MHLPSYYPLTNSFSSPNKGEFLQKLNLSGDKKYHFDAIIPALHCLDWHQVGCESWFWWQLIKWQARKDQGWWHVFLFFSSVVFLFVQGRVHKKIRGRQKSSSIRGCQTVRLFVIFYAHYKDFGENILDFAHYHLYL